MSIWSQLLDAGRSLFDPPKDIASLPEDLECQPDPNDVGFTAAVVGLGAKMAMADGEVTDDEIMVFARVFKASPDDADAVRRVFNLARQTVRGYESYARRIGKKYKGRPCLLEGVLDGLFQIATADGVVTVEELDYLHTVSHEFGFSDTTFARIKAGHLGPDPEDPYSILGVRHDAEFSDIRSAYRKLMADNHPDRVMANNNGQMREEEAHERAAAITSAYAKIRVDRGMLVSAD